MPHPEQEHRRHSTGEEEVAGSGRRHPDKDQSRDRQKDQHCAERITAIDHGDGGDTREKGKKKGCPSQEKPEAVTQVAAGREERLHNFRKNDVGIWKEMAKFNIPLGRDRAVVEFGEPRLIFRIYKS